MKRIATIVITLAVVPALFACKDRTDRTDRDRLTRPGTVTGRGVETPPSGVNPALRPSDQTTDKGLGANDTRTGAKDTRTGVTGAGSDTTSNEMAMARIHSKGTANFSGTVKIHDLTSQTGLATINLTSSTPGVYTVRIFDTSDCSELPMLDLDTGKPSVGDKANGTKPDVLAEIGDITVGKDGTGYLESSLTNIKSGLSGVKSIDNKAIGFYAKKPEPSSTKVTGTSTGKGPEACGILSTAKADMTQG